ncbi:hypothetical protein [Rhizobium sp. NXC24]|uniref:hypothetical protein n=1 Tax=Rhizobium sp. NXC24 TaxID=2048897 RepID=UPI000CDF2FC6|nr:hypothetical protein [Rhizobium sp. NXC24]AVA21598.1 hypothetical protein NXC24_CH01959 [Rhizobium sp. NXC24]
MADEIDTLNKYIEKLMERRLQVATTMLKDASPPDIQINTAAKSANNFVQIQAGIEAARKALGELTGKPANSLKETIPVAPIK